MQTTVNHYPKQCKLAMLSGLLLAAGASAGQADSGAPLGFMDAWRQALQQTPQMLSARADVAEAQGAVKAARGHLLPSLSASYTASGSDNPMNVFGMKLGQGKATFNDFGAGQFTGPGSLNIAPDNLNNPDWYTNYQSKLALQVPIYNGGETRAYLAKAKAYLSAAQQGDEAARQQLLLSLLKAYDGVRAAQSMVDVAQKAEQAANAYVSVTQKLLDKGVVSRNDLLRAQLNQGDVQLRKAEAEAQLAKAREVLRVLTGMPEGAPVDPGQRLSVQLPQGSRTELAGQASQDNPGLRALRHKLQGAEAGVDAARASYLPHFNLVLSHEWDRRHFGVGGNGSNTVAGVLSWNLLDFGGRSGALDQAHAQVSRQQAALQEAANKLRLQAQDAWRQVKLAAQQVRVRRLAIEQASENLRLEKLRYQKGVATFSELLTAQAQLDKARGELVRAHYQELLQRAGLLLALGRLTPATVTAVAAPLH